jgi:hypothetical protein
MWASEATGQSKPFRSLVQEDFAHSQGGGDAVIAELSAQVDQVRGEPPAQQRAWYASTVKSACEKTS